AHVVDGDDVRMVQGAGGPGLLRESLPAPRVGDLLGRQNLHRHRTVEIKIVRPVDDSHAAFAEFGFDPVMINGPPDHRPNSIRKSQAKRAPCALLVSSTQGTPMLVRTAVCVSLACVAALSAFQNFNK